MYVAPRELFNLEFLNQAVLFGYKCKRLRLYHMGNVGPGGCTVIEKCISCVSINHRERGTKSMESKDLEFKKKGYFLQKHVSEFLKKGWFSE